MWQEVSLMSFFSTYQVQQQQDLPFHYLVWFSVLHGWTLLNYDFPSSQFSHPGPWEVEPQPEQHLWDDELKQDQLMFPALKRISLMDVSLWSWFEARMVWYSLDDDWRSSVSATWNGLRVRTSGGGTYKSKLQTEFPAQNAKDVVQVREEQETQKLKQRSQWRCHQILNFKFY